MASQTPAPVVIGLLQEKVQSVVVDCGFELFDFEFVKEGVDWFLRIYIDKEGDIGIDDCETVSRRVEKMLDENDPIQQAYSLEVSSPGIDRPLRNEADYEKYAGRIVDIKLYKAVNKSKAFSGTLKGLDDGVVTILDSRGKEQSFLKTDIASCRLAVIF